MSTSRVVLISVVLAAVAAVAVVARRSDPPSNSRVRPPDRADEVVEKKLTLRDELGRVFPRVVLPSFVLQGEGARLVRRPVDGIGVYSVYCIDGDASVAFIARDMLESSGVDLETLHARALANLARTHGGVRSLVRGALEERKLVVVKMGDTYDAARLLLVPSELRDGESVVATLPDRDTLSLMAPVPEESRERLIEMARKLARDPERPLLDVPVIVRSSGFEVMRSAPN